MATLKTRLSKTGQPVMGTTVQVAMGMDDPEAARTDMELLAEWESAGCVVEWDSPTVWLPVKVVGKLYGRGGNSDLVGLVVEDHGGGRARIEMADWRAIP